MLRLSKLNRLLKVLENFIIAGILEKVIAFHETHVHFSPELCESSPHVNTSFL
jgi:hypothetical protein